MAQSKKEAPHPHPKLEAKLEQQKQLMKEYFNNLTLGQKLADKITYFGGSWTFIISFMIFLLVWIALNIYWLTIRWDPYPFILLNLVLSCLAAIQAPIILMSQNREAERDRVKIERDYTINRKAEREVQDIQMDLEEIKSMIKKLKK